MNTRLGMCLTLLLVLPASAYAQNQEAIVIFKDGFHVAGKPTQPKSFILDPSGSSFTTAKPAA